MTIIREYQARPRRLSYSRAPNGVRLEAYIIDRVIGFGPVIMAWILDALFHVTQSKATMTFNMLATFAWAVYYALTKDGHGNGQSIGKKACGLMVINIDTGEPCSLGQSIGRGMVSGALGAIPLLGWFMEPIMVLADGDGRRLADHAADTQVIDVSVYEARAEARG